MSGAAEGVAPCPFCNNLPRIWKGGPFFFREDWASCQGHDGSGSSDVGHPTIRMPLRLWNTRTTPPARSYADGVEDAAKVADDLANAAASLQAALELHGVDAPVKNAQRETATTLAAAIRILSQEPQP